MYRFESARPARTHECPRHQGVISISGRRLLRELVEIPVESASSAYGIYPGTPHCPIPMRGHSSRCLAMDSTIVDSS
jgi:hypothetical protein